jgi:PAS domain S-box-containing protein
LIENINDGVYTLDSFGKFTFVNDVIVERSGYPAEWFLSRSYLDIVSEKDHEHVQKSFNEVMDGKTRIYNLSYPAKSEDLLYVEVCTAPLFDDAKVIGLLGISRDITERKQAEATLHRNEENFRHSLDDSPMGVRVVNIEGETIYANRAILDIYGFDSFDELKETPPMKRYTPESYAEFQIRREKRLQGVDTPSEYTIRIIRKDGKVRHLHVFRKEILWDGERQFQVLYRDITERRQAEQALVKSEEKYRSLLDHASDAIFLADMEGNLLEANKKAEELIGYSKVEISELNISRIHPAEIFGKIKDIFNEIITNGSSYVHDASVLRKDGKIINVDITGSLIEHAGTKVVQGIFRDITERKRAEDKIRASLREKEILLSEIHHRVKNNMQVISSLLDLQARSSGNPELTEKLNESQSRIRSMAMIHEKLYESKDFARIDLAGYVRALSEELFQSYKIRPGKIDLIVQTNGDVYVDINKAIPCGLILNEMISNALKHAFPGNRHGELQITINETKSTEVEIIVLDNGLGLPDDIDIHEPRTVGLYLVNGLVKNQIDGQVEVRRDNGTEFRIKLPL